MTATLAETVSKVRYETGQTARASQGNHDRDHIVHLINRVQGQLATQFDWPRRHEAQTVEIVAGQYVYPIPEPFTFEGIERVLASRHDRPVLLHYGIEAEHRAYLDPEAVSDRRYPPRRWQYQTGTGGGDEMEIWPTPDQDGLLTLEGSGRLLHLTADNQMLAFNADMVALYVASEVLAAQGSELAGAKSGMADELRRSEMHRQKAKKGGAFMLGGAGSHPRPLRYGIDYMD
jgi:hypothetical protein